MSTPSEPDDRDALLDRSRLQGFALSSGYRWLDQAKKVVECIGEEEARKITTTIIANDMRFLGKLPLVPKDKALAVLNVYTNGRGKKAATKLLDKYIHVETMSALKPAPAIGGTSGAEKAKSEFRNVVLYGDVLARLADIPTNHVQTIITSPPFYNVRDYGTRSWFGGKPACKHTMDKSSTCTTCGAWYGQLGLEPTVALYIDHLVAVFHACHRVLRDDGVLWIEIDDSFSGSGRGFTTGKQKHGKRRGRVAAGVTAPEMPPKNMVLVPERLIIALQAGGWTVRSKVVWHKTTGLGEAVKDRCSHAHSTIYMLTNTP